MRKIIVAAAATAVFSSPLSAYALDVGFSFTGTGGGTVTGEIFGLNDNGESAAADIQINSAPAFIGLPPTPFDLFPVLFSLTNHFTVSAGHP